VQVIEPREVEPQAMEMQGAHKVTMRVVLGPDQGAPTFVMRLFEVEQGGYTPMHAHDWEHEVFVLQGEVEVASPTGRLPAHAGMAAYVAPGETHRFVNIGAGVLRFLCVIPVQGKPG
jgi:quercetin dioxygenase-like cupin family protein